MIWIYIVCSIKYILKISFAFRVLLITISITQKAYKKKIYSLNRTKDRYQFGFFLVVFNAAVIYLTYVSDCTVFWTHQRIQVAASLVVTVHVSKEQF